MLRCGVVEDQEDLIVRFYGGLRRDIQDIVDYKEYHSIQRLFHLSMLAEKELQGRQQQRRSNTVTPRQPLAPAKSAPSSSFRAPTPSSSTGARSTAPPPSRGHDHSGSAAPQGVAAKNSSSNPSPGRTSDIKCHRCHGLGHMQRDCPSKRTYIATNDGYVSASDNEDEYYIGTNHAGAGDDNDNADEEVLDAGATEKYRTLIVHRALSTKVESDDKIHRHNLFHTFLIVKDCRVHTHPYHIQWLNNSGKVKVTQTARVHFSIGSYHDYADFDVVPMDACSLLLGRPWEFDTDALHHGRTNKYTLMHKGKKIILLPMSPAEIVKYEQ